MSKRILLLDGDVIVYRNAAAVEERTVKVTHNKSQRTKEFKNRTEFKEFLKEKKFDYKPEDYTIEDIQKANDISVALAIINKLVNNLYDFTWADEYEIWLGNNSDVFRHSLALPEPYKGNRAAMIKPLHFELCKQHLIKKHGARLSVSGLETDDMLTIRCYEEKSKGNYPIMGTIDKDANQSQGIAVLNFMEEPYSIVDIPDVGNVEQVTKGTYKKVVGNGLKFLAYQALAGDPTDTYQPYKLSKIPYGSSKALKVLTPCQTEEEILRVIVSEYKKMYPGEFEYTDHAGVLRTATWKEMLDMYWKCAYMKRSRDDESDFFEFARQRGVTFDD